MPNTGTEGLGSRGPVGKAVDCVRAGHCAQHRCGRRGPELSFCRKTVSGLQRHGEPASSWQEALAKEVLTAWREGKSGRKKAELVALADAA